MSLTVEQLEIKDEFLRVRGTWSDAWERVLELDPGFLRTYLRFSAVPWEQGHLEPKVKEFIHITVDAAATHLFSPGIRQHINAALGYGATAAEIMEVLELTSTLGIHACNVGFPLLLEVLEEEGRRDGPASLSPRQEELKARFENDRGYWHESWDCFLELAPELLDAYLDFSSVPWKTGILEPKVKEFIYTAFDASATHLYAPGLKIHMRNALHHGATVEELVEVLEIAAVVGMHTALVGAPILADAIAPLPSATGTSG